MNVVCGGRSVDCGEKVDVPPKTILVPMLMYIGPFLLKLTLIWSPTRLTIASSLQEKFACAEYISFYAIGTIPTIMDH